jgi:hypothetical protein
MDCVTEQGDAVILYCAALSWRAVHAVYSSVLAVHDGLTESRSSMTPYRLFSSPGDICVEFPRLHVSGRWEADATPHCRTVFESPEGAVASPA